MAPKIRPLIIDDNHALWFLLTRTSDMALKVTERELNQHGITNRTAAVLFTILRQGEKATPGAISMELFLEPHTISEQLARMQKHGLVRKVRERGKNHVRVEVTPLGYEIFRHASRNISIEYIMSALNSHEQQQLWILLAKIRDRALQRLGAEAVTIYPTSDSTPLAQVAGASSHKPPP